MGCSLSGLNTLYDAMNGGADVWINDNRFKIVRQLGEGGFAFVYLVKEVVINDVSSNALSSKFKDPSHISEDGTYAMKKVLIQNSDQLALVKEEIRVSALFCHPNLLPLLDHAIIPVKGAPDQTWTHEAYLLFPVHLDGTLLDNTTTMKSKKEFFSTSDVLQIFRQLCAGLQHMHTLEPPYAHNDVKPGNVLLTHRKGQPPLAILMDFGSARPARREIRSRSEALQLQEWASEHVSAPFRAPELWDCPSHTDIDERTDVWYGASPFEYALGESGGSLQLAIINGQIKWPASPKPPYPEALHQFVSWMLQPQATVRPRIDDIIIHLHTSAIEVGEQIAKNETDSWLLPNPYNGENLTGLSSHQIDGCMSFRSYSPWARNQYQCQFSQMQPQDIQVNYSGNYGTFLVQSSSRDEQEQILKYSQGIQHDFSRTIYNNTPADFFNASLPPTDDGIVPEAKLSSFSNTMNLPHEWEQNHLSFLPFHHGNLIEEAVGSHSNSTSISSEGTQQLILSDDSKKASEFPQMSRQDRSYVTLRKRKQENTK
ncbi:serine/threonine-protein kinase 16-like protein [Tanacetum coccineum]